MYRKLAEVPQASSPVRIGAQVCETARAKGAFSPVDPISLHDCYGERVDPFEGPFYAECGIAFALSGRNGSSNR